MKTPEEIAQLAREFATKPINPDNPIGTITCLVTQNGYEKGYTQCQADNGNAWINDCRCSPEETTGAMWCCNICGKPTVVKGLADNAELVNKFWNEYRSETNNTDAWMFKQWLVIKLTSLNK
jgi:hypothetical protein